MGAKWEVKQQDSNWCPYGMATLQVEAYATIPWSAGTRIKRAQGLTLRRFPTKGPAEKEQDDSKQNTCVELCGLPAARSLLDSVGPAIKWEPAAVSTCLSSACHVRVSGSENLAVEGKFFPLSVKKGARC